MHLNDERLGEGLEGKDERHRYDGRLPQATYLDNINNRAPGIRSRLLTMGCTA
jgi:hypothetical protein